MSSLEKLPLRSRQVLAKRPAGLLPGADRDWPAKTPQRGSPER